MLFLVHFRIVCKSGVDVRSTGRGLVCLNSDVRGLDLQYDIQMLCAIILHHFTHNYDHNIGSINYKKGLSIIYLSWDRKLIGYLLHNFEFRFLTKSKRFKNLGTPLLCVFRQSHAHTVQANAQHATVGMYLSHVYGRFLLTKYVGLVLSLLVCLLLRK